MHSLKKTISAINDNPVINLTTDIINNNTKMIPLNLPIVNIIVTQTGDAKESCYTKVG